MTAEISLVLLILGITILLFISERLRPDLIALLVLGSLALTGLVTPTEALSGFSNPAVVTVWAMFVLSGGLAQTGVADLIGRQVLRLSGQGETRLLLVIMLTAGGLSAFMNNVGVAALMLPVVMEIARRTQRPPSRLLMPLAFGSLLGGLTTLIGTPPNIIASDALREFGLRPFQFFDFAPVGVVVLVVGVTFMVVVGRHLLPDRDVIQETAAPVSPDLEQLYQLQERLFAIRVPAGSVLMGKSLAESRMGSVLGLNVVSIIRNGQTHLSPEPSQVLHAGDRLLVVGRPDRLSELRQHELLTVEQPSLARENITGAGIEVTEVKLQPGSAYLGQTLSQIDFRQRFGVNVSAIRRQGELKRTNLQALPLQPDDVMLVQGPPDRVRALADTADFVVSETEAAEIYRLHERLLLVRVSPDSALVGKTLVESHLGDAFGLTVLEIVRDGDIQVLPEATTELRAGDTLLVEGRQEDIAAIHSFEELELDKAPAAIEGLESAQVGLVEAVLSPHTTLVGQTLRQLHFREKYGLNVLAIWRGGRAYRANLRDVALRFGDALLLHGSRDKIQVLGSEPDFLVLTTEAQAPLRLRKAPLAVLIMAAVLLPVLLGWIPISISAVAGASLMILSGCLNMEEAYRFIEWRSVFFIAGLVPLGLAMQHSGTAQFLAQEMVAAIGELGPIVVLAGLFILTSLATQVMPNPVVTVLLAPIALSTASDMGVSPYTFMMGIALAASASFLSPVSHPANVLIMGPGGYRFGDYIRVGLPLTAVILVVVLLVLPMVWPLGLN